MTQPAVVAASPSVQFPLAGDGRAVCGATRDGHHCLALELLYQCWLLTGIAVTVSKATAIPIPPGVYLMGNSNNTLDTMIKGQHNS